MSGRSGKRHQSGFDKNRLILALLIIAAVVGLTAFGLYRNGSLTLDNLLIELGLKEPTPVTIDIGSIPEYSGEPYVALENNQPDFDAKDLTTEPFETYSDLDYLGRCGVAYANICLEIMPTEPRGEISSVKPTGWHTAKYDCVEGKYLYNRCHLIGYQLAGENANEKNLITGLQRRIPQFPVRNLPHQGRHRGLFPRQPRRWASPQRSPRWRGHHDQRPHFRS